MWSPDRGSTLRMASVPAAQNGAARDGIRVIDLTANMADPYATMVLGDQGADLVKIEHPSGDLIRRIGTGRREWSAHFANLNRSKRSVAIDLHSPGGVAVLDRLLDDADVLVQHFRWGVVDRLGIGPEAVLAKHPRLVYASNTGFGSSGRFAALPAYDHVIQVYSGMAGYRPQRWSTDARPTWHRRQSDRPHDC